MSELVAFAGLHQALARLCLRDGRSRKEIAEAAGINASMLSGYLSGRRVPSLEHLDRLLTEIGMGVEELTYELRSVGYRAAPTQPLVLWPQFFDNPEGEKAAALLTVLLENLRGMLLGSATEGPPPREEAPRGGRASKKGTKPGP
jgi:transcriptional regulator with XRE-family HTH domain